MARYVRRVRSGSLNRHLFDVFLAVFTAFAVGPLAWLVFPCSGAGARARPPAPPWDAL